MTIVAGIAAGHPRVFDQLCHSRHQSRERQSQASSGTYDAVVATSSDPRVLHFGLFVKRSLVEARARGMSIEQVEKATGVPRSTMYRWRRGEIENPQRKQVHQFCDGLGIARTTPAQILGWDGSPPSADPEPSIDPDLRAIMRRLNDPNVTAEEKTTIRQMLRYLAQGG